MLYMDQMMKENELAKKRENNLVNTVTGQIAVNNLGITLFHEHIFINAQGAYQKPEDANALILKDKKVSIKDLCLLRDFPYSCLDNCVLNDYYISLSEVLDYHSYGGNTIIEVTGINCGRSPSLLYEISKNSNVNIIMGSSFYLDRTQPDWAKDKDEFELTEFLTNEINQGINIGYSQNIYPGVIGEVGISENFTNNEKKSLIASAKTQLITGLPLSIHTPAWKRLGNKILDICEKVGVNPNSIVLDHMDPSIHDEEYQLGLLKRNVFLEFDGIGMGLFYPGEGQNPCDEEIAVAIENLVNKGYIKQILLSHDVFLKIMLREYGGNGYSHILRSFVPRLQRHGLKKEMINSILINNPKQVFIQAQKCLKIN